jgi:hypothetical protein
MELKTRKTALSLGDVHYFTGKPCHKGHVAFRFAKTGHCNDCVQERNRSSEKIEYRKKYKQENYEAILKKNKTLYAKNPEQYRRYNKEYQQKNAVTLRPKNSARTMKRLAAKLQRTPSWLSVDDNWMIDQAYELAAIRKKATGIPWDVDHIIPLQGKLVSGLHVPWNLQVIPASINRSKGNKIMEARNG